MQFGRTGLFLLCLTAALNFGALSVNASTVTYTDQTAWSGATSGVTAIDFAGLAAAGGTHDYSNSTGLAIGGVDFQGVQTDNTFSLAVMDQNYIFPYYDFGAPATLQSPSYNLPANPIFVPYTHVVLPTNVTAFGVDLMTISPNALSYQITLSDGETFTSSTNNRPSQTFFGITSDSPITYANFTVIGEDAFSGSYGLMANFQFGSAAAGNGGGDTGAVPEGSTLALIGSGLVALYSMRKRVGGGLFNSNLA